MLKVKKITHKIMGPDEVISLYEFNDDTYIEFIGKRIIPPKMDALIKIARRVERKEAYLSDIYKLPQVSKGILYLFRSDLDEDFYHYLIINNSEGYDTYNYPVYEGGNTIIDNILLTWS